VRVTLKHDLDNRSRIMCLELGMMLKSIVTILSPLAAFVPAELRKSTNCIRSIESEKGTLVELTYIDIVFLCSMLRMLITANVFLVRRFLSP
jgi:hypothetical protein